jgi:charged multivesicular body protein 6
MEMKKKIKVLLSSNKKERALMLLKVMKLKEKKVEEVDAQQLTVSEMILQLESATITAPVLEAIEAGTQALHELHSEYSIERVEQILEDSNEAIAVRTRYLHHTFKTRTCFICYSQVQNEISDLLRKHSTFSAEEETELQSELDVLVNGPNHSANAVVLPEVPSHNVVLTSHNSEQISSATAADAKILLASI